MFEKDKKYFPIKTATACSLKWGWSTILLKTAKTKSCHRCLNLPLTEDNFDDFHNLPHKLKEREIMLQGKWPTTENGGSGHCNFCKVHEDSGEMSDRQRHLTVPNLTPEEVLQNSSALKVTPTILEIYLNNTCNMKCVYCGPFFSTQWQSELIQHGNIEIDDDVIQKKIHTSDELQKKLFKKTLDWLDKNGHKLRRLHILGGEPFYQQEFAELLDFLKTKKFRHLELNAISNLMVKENVFYGYIDKIKKLLLDRHIGRFDLTASIDNWGDQAEYARFGLKIDHWKKLFEYCVNNKWIYLNINNTISCLTIKTLPDLLDYLNSQRKIRKISHHGGETVGPIEELLHPKIYGKKFWESDFRKIIQKMDNDEDKQMQKIMRGVYESLPHDEPNYKNIKKMKNYLVTLDKRRNTNWRKTYPYLDI